MVAEILFGCYDFCVCMKENIRQVKRLVVTGIACPSDVWAQFLGKNECQRIITIREIFANVSSSDPRELSKYVTSVIEEYKPQSIICHDMGVPLTLLSLIRLSWRNFYFITKVTLFNGILRGINLLKTTHLFKAQFMTVRGAIKELRSKGGKVDFQLSQYFPRIKAMFRMILLYGISEKLSDLFGIGELTGFSKRVHYLKVPIQIIASRNDPYIPYESILRLKNDLKPIRFYELEYGHFPYSGEKRKIIELIEDFENK